MTLPVGCFNATPESFFIPAVFALIGVILLLNEVRFGRKAVAAVGEVIDLQYRRGSRGRGGYCPVVCFQCTDGEHWEEEIVFTSSVSSRPSFCQVGDSIPVLYDPAYPQHARINTFGYRWLLSCVFTVFGLGLLLVMVLPWCR